MYKRRYFGSKISVLYQLQLSTTLCQTTKPSSSLVIMYVITDNKSDAQNDLTLTENQSNLPCFRIIKITLSYTIEKSSSELRLRVNTISNGCIWKSDYIKQFVSKFITFMVSLFQQDNDDILLRQSEEGADYAATVKHPKLCLSIHY